MQTTKEYRHVLKRINLKASNSEAFRHCVLWLIITDAYKHDVRGLIFDSALLKYSRIRKDLLRFVPFKVLTVAGRQHDCRTQPEIPHPKILRPKRLGLR